MRLFYIDTHENGHYTFGWLGDRGQVWDYEGRTGNFVYQMIRQIKLDQLKKADGICVVSGPGSFSSIRAGVLAANLLARSLDLKLYSLPAKQGKISDMDITNLEPQIFVAPKYDREPNITLK